MSQNPPNSPSDYYSLQSLATRLFQLDLQVENIKYILRQHIDKLKEVDAAILDLQHQIRQCMARRDEQSGTKIGWLEKKTDTSA